MKTIFVSSTFNDMQAERNLLHTRIMPEINSQLQKSGDYARFLDFRWGINTENMNDEVAMRKVLSTCFDAISNSSYVIVFIGNKYGTSVPYPIIHEICQEYNMNVSFGEKSITELEVNFATETNFINTKNVVFYFRRDQSNEDSDPRVSHLKEYIKKLYPHQVRYYNGDLQNHENEFTTEIVEDLLFLFSKGNTSALHYTDTISKNYALKWSSRFELMESAVSSALHNEITIISGASGSGKTIFMSALREKIKNIAHTEIDYVPKTLDIEKGVKYRVWNLLGYTLEHTYYILNKKCYGTDYDTMITEQCNVLRKHPIPKPFVMFIDGIDKFHTIEDITETLNFIKKHCTCVHFVISLCDPEAFILPSSANIIYLNLLSDEEKLCVIKHELKSNEKSLDEQSIRLLMNKKDSHFPLYLSLAIKRLVLMQKEDYANIFLKKEENVKVDVSVAINKYIYDIIDSFSEDIENVIVDYIEFSTQIINNKGFAINVAAFLSSSFRGYTDAELLLLIDQNGFLAHPEIVKSFRNQNIAFVHGFSFAECELYLFRKYLGDLIFHDNFGRNYYENTIVKESVYRLYRCKNICDYRISLLSTVDHEERVIPFSEIIASIIRSRNYKYIFSLFDAFLYSQEDPFLIEVITKVFLDTYMDNEENFEQKFFKYARKYDCKEVFNSMRFALMKMLAILSGSSIDPIRFVPFFKKCIGFLKKRMDYSILKHRLFLIMADFNIAMLLKNSGYTGDALVTGMVCLRKLNAIQKEERNDMYYEALETVENFIESFS